MIFLQIKDSTEIIDTTLVGYQIGHTIGSWLPYIVVVTIFILIVRKRYQFNKRH